MQQSIKPHDYYVLKFDWLVFNANFSSILDISWCEQILQINFLLRFELPQKCQHLVAQLHFVSI